MYVINVVPLSRTAPGMLTYRSSTKLSVGSIVNIVIRKTQTQGIVVEVTHVKDAKEMLKNARFLLSKSTPSTAGSLPASTMQAARSTAAYHATSTGAVLTALFAEHIAQGIPLPTATLSTHDHFIQEAVEAPLTHRLKTYAACIEEKGVVLLVVPTIAEVTYWKQVFKDYKPLVLSGALKASARVEAIESAFTHSGLIIATPSFSWVPVKNLTRIIIDRVSAGTYILPKRPYISVVHALLALTEAREIPCVLGDFPLPLEFRPDPTAPMSVSLNTTTRIVDMRRDPDSKTEGKPWKIFPDEVLVKIEDCIRRKEQVVVLASRKGYAPSVMCKDCGQAQTDDRGVPLTFSVAKGKRVFNTNNGISVLVAGRTCQRCDSWNLLPLGIGVEKVAEELHAHFPTAPISLLAAEDINSPGKAKKALTAAYDTHSIIIGSEALLPWLALYPNPDTKTLGIIASADSLLSLPFWRARERFIRLAYFFSGLTSELILLTRRPEDTAVDAVANPTTSLFWKEESELRKALQYPPFGVLISLTSESSQSSLSASVEQLQAQFQEYSPNVLPVQTLSVSRSAQTMLLSLPRDTWPDERLLAYITSLPPSVRVRIDPESFR